MPVIACPNLSEKPSGEAFAAHSFSEPPKNMPEQLPCDEKFTGCDWIFRNIAYICGLKFMFENIIDTNVRNSRDCRSAI